MNGSASERAIFASTGWPASFASACSASPRARGAAPVGREVQMPEAQPGRLREFGAVLLEPALELGGRRLARGGHVLGQELHLLRHAALDDLVVLVEAHRERLAVEDFLLHLVLDHALELLRRRRAAPLRLVQQGELGDLVERQPDLLRRRDRRASGLREAVEAEQNRADQQEVNERFTQQALHRIGKRSLARCEIAGLAPRSAMGSSIVAFPSGTAISGASA